MERRLLRESVSVCTAHPTRGQCAHLWYEAVVERQAEEGAGHGAQSEHKEVPVIRGRFAEFEALHVQRVRIRCALMRGWRYLQLRQIGGDVVVEEEQSGEQ